MASLLSKPSVLLIDDQKAVLDGLKAALAGHLGTTAKIITWQPSESDADPLAKLQDLVDRNTVLVVTDYDLTSGLRGLFGPTIVGWCQQRSIPVGDFSRGNIAALPKEPNLFELRVPSDEAEGAQFIASTFEGFRKIGKMLERDPTIIASKWSPAAVLAVVLGKSHLESQFALYMLRLGAANSSLLEILKNSIGGAEPLMSKKKRLITYVLGHVLVNAILKYPGPILSEEALCAYLATARSEAPNLYSIFSKATYTGPFGHNAQFYWREDIDEIIDELSTNIDEGDFDKEQSETFGGFNRRVIENFLDRQLEVHNCDRCGGRNGGFWCPFTQRPVCLRPDCSVAASSWIPQGAQLCRVERTFYDEWAPLLGL